MPRVSHSITVYVLRYTHQRYMKCLFTNTKNNRICLKTAYFLRKIQTSWLNNSRILRIKNAKLKGFYEPQFLYEPDHIVKFSNLH